MKKGIAALRANPKKAMGVMKRKTGGRCCLCVLAETAAEICKAPIESFSGTNMPTIDLALVFPVRTCYSDVKLGGAHASELNDGTSGHKEHTHKEIADLLEAEYLKLKKLDLLADFC